MTPVNVYDKSRFETYDSCTALTWMVPPKSWASRAGDIDATEGFWDTVLFGLHGDLDT